MEVLGSLLIILALAIIIALFVARPFFNRVYARPAGVELQQVEEYEHRRSTLLAERDRVLNALQELEFDNILGKVPDEDFPLQRTELMQQGAAILRELDQMEPGVEVTSTAEDRLEAAVAARRADAATRDGMVLVKEGRPNGNQGQAPDKLDDLIAARRRQREEKSAGFCPRCGRPVQKSDRFCSRCGTTL